MIEVILFRGETLEFNKFSGERSRKGQIRLYPFLGTSVTCDEWDDMRKEYKSRTGFDLLNVCRVSGLDKVSGSKVTEDYSASDNALDAYKLLSQNPLKPKAEVIEEQPVEELPDKPEVPETGFSKTSKKKK